MPKLKSVDDDGTLYSPTVSTLTRKERADFTTKNTFKKPSWDLKKKKK